MTHGFLTSYAPILIHFLVAAGLSALLILVSYLIGESKPSKSKLAPYECGIIPSGNAKEPFAVKFYVVAILFILFDVEAMFLIAWAVVYRGLGFYGFTVMFIFLVLFLAGFAYEWKKGALDWAPGSKERR